MGFGPVLIIGASTCGLAIAQGLQKANIFFHIFDSDAGCATELDDSITDISTSLMTLRDLLPENVKDEIETEMILHSSRNRNQRIQSDMKVVDGNSGKLIGDIEGRQQSSQIRKSKLRLLLQRGMNVVYEHTLQSIEYTEDGNVFAVFTNGERYWGSLVVGTDGPSSFVRQILFGADRATPVCTEAVYTDINITYPPDVARLLLAMKSVSNIGVVQDCMVMVSTLDIEDVDQPETWRFQVFMCWKKDKEGKRKVPDHTIHDILKSKAGLFNEPFRSAILHIRKEVDIQIQEVNSWTPTCWHSRGGRVTLAGNAAHLMPPNNILSLNNAIADAHSFVDAIKKIVNGDSIKAQAIPSYGHAIVARAIKQAQFHQDPCLSTLEHAVLSKGTFSTHSLALALRCSDARESLSETSTRTSGSETSGKTRSETSSKGRKALSRTRTWFRNQIDNLDVGAEQGTAQTTWVGTGQKAYGRRYFPD